jgi:hypothetical protein
VGRLNQRPLLLNGQGPLFFQPVEFDLQLANLPVERYLEYFFPCCLGPRRLDNRVGNPSKATFFHCVICRGCTLLVRGNFIERALPTVRFQDHFGFELATMLPPLHGHRDVLPNALPNLTYSGIHFLGHIIEAHGP